MLRAQVIWTVYLSGTLRIVRVPIYLDRGESKVSIVSLNANQKYPGGKSMYSMGLERSCHVLLRRRGEREAISHISARQVQESVEG